MAKERVVATKCCNLASNAALGELPRGSDSLRHHARAEEIAADHRLRLERGDQAHREPAAVKARAGLAQLFLRQAAL